MTREEAYAQYEHEVALFEQWGQKNITTFDEWLEIKGITIDKQPLPSDVDEAAEKYGMWRYAEEEPLAIRNFKAGAEWMAEQGVVADFEVNKLAVRAWLTAADEDKFQKDIYDNFEAGDKVIVQIRK